MNSVFVVLACALTTIQFLFLLLSMNTFKMYTPSTVDNKPVRYAVVAFILIASISFLSAHCYGGRKPGGKIPPEPEPQHPEPLPEDPTKPTDPPEEPPKPADPPTDPAQPSDPPKDQPKPGPEPTPHDPPKPGPKDITSDISPGSKVACVRYQGYHLFWQDQRGRIRLSQSTGIEWKNLDCIVAEDVKTNSPIAAVCQSAGSKGSIGVYYFSGNNELCEAWTEDAWKEGGPETFQISKLGSSGSLFSVHADSQLAAVVENSPALTGMPSIYVYAQNESSKVAQYEKNGNDGSWKAGHYTMPPSSPGTNIAASIVEGMLFVVFQNTNQKLEVLTRRPLMGSHHPWDSDAELPFEVPCKTPMLCLSWKYPGPQTFNLLFGVKSGRLHQSIYGNKGFVDSEALASDILEIGGGDIGLCGVVQIKKDKSRVRRLYLRPAGKAVLQEFQFPT